MNNQYMTFYNTSTGAETCLCFNNGRFYINGELQTDEVDKNINSVILEKINGLYSEGYIISELVML